MLRVGLTGGLGSGKSTAARLFRSLGVHVIEADEVGRALMQPGQAVYAAILRHFGPGVLGADGALDRKALADIAFRQGRLHELNSIVHPPVIAVQEDWMQRVFTAHAGAIGMVESALIFEAGGDAGVDDGNDPTVPGWRRRFDRIVLITAPHEMKVARFVERESANFDHRPGDRQALAKSAKMRLAAQLPDARKAPMSDYVIANAGSLADLEKRVVEVYESLRNEADATA